MLALSMTYWTSQDRSRQDGARERFFQHGSVIQNVVNIVSYKIEEKEIGFRLSRDPEIPNWFFGDAKRIEQVLLNTLNNAVKFTSAGEVSLDVRLVARESDRYYLSLSIRDTGIGMTEEQIAKLFNPFVQGDSSIDRRFGGSGLGLSIVKSLVDMMGGQIQVFSTPGEDSTFVIHLSLVGDSEKQDIHARTVSADHFKDVRILVLEKSGSDMSLIESYLSAFGVRCELTSSEASALSMLIEADGTSARPFDLLILDYDTPSGGGFKFVESIRSHSKVVKAPKIIMLLPMIREDLFDKLGEHGVDLGIGKPIIPSNLLDGVLDVLGLRALPESQSAAASEARTIRPGEGNTTRPGEAGMTRLSEASSTRPGEDSLERLSEARPAGPGTLASQDLWRPVDGACGGQSDGTWRRWTDEARRSWSNEAPRGWPGGLGPARRDLARPPDKT